MNRVGKYVLFVFVFLLLIPNVSADVPIFEPWTLDVQGAKIVSEGAYFFFQVTNIINETLGVYTHVPYRFSPAAYPKIILEPNESFNFTFMAPPVDYKYKQFAFHFKVFNESAPKTTIIDEVYFIMSVVKLDLLHRLDVATNFLILSVLLNIASVVAITFIVTRLKRTKEKQGTEAKSLID